MGQDSRQTSCLIERAPSFAVIGDFCLAGEQVASANASNQAWSSWVGLSAALGDSLPVIGNLECAITDAPNGRPNKYANLRANTELSRQLSGLSLAILSNNHVSDFGDRGVADTCDTLDKLGIKWAGYGDDILKACQPSFLAIGRFRLGVLTFCCPTTNGENLATHLTPGVSPMSMAVMQKAISTTKRACDALLVYMHWGMEHVHDPVPDQIRVGRHAIDCGADAVVGCHAHTIQSWERYKGRWIFYGLGNFLFGDISVVRLLPDDTLVTDIHRQAQKNRESLVVVFNIVPNERFGPITLNQVHFFAFDDDLCPRPIDKSALTFDLDEANARLARYCQRNSVFLAERHEPNLICHFRNGILAYFYANGPLAPLARVERTTDSFIRIFKKMARKLINHFNLQRLRNMAVDGTKIIRNALIGTER